MDVCVLPAIQFRLQFLFASLSGFVLVVGMVVASPSGLEDLSSVICNQFSAQRPFWRGGNLLPAVLEPLTASLV